MGRFLIYIITLVVAVATIFFSVAAYHNFLFWKLAYLDIAIHFLAGMSVSLIGLTLYFSLVKPSFLRFNFSFFNVLTVALVTALFVGGIWELFEFTLDELWTAELTVKQLSFLKFSMNDTLSDLFFDCLGAAGAALIFWFNWRPHKDNINIEKTEIDQSSI
ncbi:MAG: hypothetical protein WDZ73_01255 [Candidatus Paceibacterota bacterium]